MSFTCTGLPISKNSSIVSLKYVRNNRFCSFVEDILLSISLTKNSIESKLFRRSLRTWLGYKNCCRSALYDFLISVCLFFGIQRSASDAYLY
jgi:hypothetical protein